MRPSRIGGALHSGDSEDDIPATNVYCRDALVKARYRGMRFTDGPCIAAGVDIPDSHNRYFKPSDDVSRHAVLILSTDALAAALLGAAVELAGHVPHFARQSEAARASLIRVRPKLVLIDCDHDDACSDEFVGPSLMMGSKVLLFRSRRTEHDRSEFANRMSLRMIDMPLDHRSLTQTLNEMLGD